MYYTNAPRSFKKVTAKYLRKGKFGLPIVHVFAPSTSDDGRSFLIEFFFIKVLFQKLFFKPALCMNQFLFVV